MKRLYLASLIFILSLAGFISCLKDDDDIWDVGPANKPPIAQAGPDQLVILPKDSAILNGTLSADPDGSIEAWRWVKISGPGAVVFGNAAAAITVVRPLQEGIYHFELSVQDNKGVYDRDTIKIEVIPSTGNNQPPVAHAGDDQDIPVPFSTCVLNGSASYDPDGLIRSYRWTKVAGPESYSILNSTVAQTTANNLVEGTYLFELEVTDNGGLTDKDTVRIYLYVAGNCNGNTAHVNATLTEIGTLSVARSPHVAAAGSKIVFAGGRPFTDAVDIYDVNDHSWTRTRLSQARGNMCMVSAGSKIFFAGGNNSEDQVDLVEIYDVSTGNWLVRHFSEPKSYVGAAVLGDRVFFAGGITDGGWDQTGKVEIYDISDDTWTTAELSVPRILVTGVTAGNKVYFAGGWNYLGSFDPLRTVDIYDNASSTWSASTLNVLAGGVSGLVSGNQVYWAGLNYPQLEAKAETWDLPGGQTTVNCLSYPRYFPGIAERQNEIVYFTSGSWLDNSIYSGQFDIYNRVTGVWSVGHLGRPLTGAGFIGVNNTIYVGGGQTGASTYSNKVYVLSW